LDKIVSVGNAGRSAGGKIMYRATTVVLIAFVVGLATQVSARNVSIKGTYSAGKLGAICSNNNGHFFNTANGGYGCTAGSGNGGTVTCNGKGKCKGWVPLLQNPGGKGTTRPTKTKGGNGTGNVIHPVNVRAPNGPTEVKTPIATGRGGGMNQGNHRH